MYIWDKEIENIDDNWLVQFNDWSSKLYTLRQLEYIKTEEKKDATELRDIVLDNVWGDIMKLLNEHNIRHWDLKAILDVVYQSHRTHLNFAIWKAFGTYSNNIHPEQCIEDITRSDIKKITDL